MVSPELPAPSKSNTSRPPRRSPAAILAPALFVSVILPVALLKSIVLPCPAQTVPLLVRVKFTELDASIVSSQPDPQCISSVGEPSV